MSKMIDFAKMFILFLFAMGIGYSMISISQRGLRYKKYLAEKGKETEAKVVKIISSKWWTYPERRWHRKSCRPVRRP